MERRVVGCLWGRARRAAGGAAAAAPPRPGRVPASGWGCVRRARAARGPAGSRVCPRVAAGAASHVAWARPRLRGPPKRGSAGAGCLSGRARPPASVRIADRWRGGRCRDGWGRAASRGSWAGARRRATRGAGRRRAGTAPSRGGSEVDGRRRKCFFFFSSRRRAQILPAPKPAPRRPRPREPPVFPQSARETRPTRTSAACRTLSDLRRFRLRQPSRRFMSPAAPSGPPARRRRPRREPRPGAARGPSAGSLTPRETAGSRVAGAWEPVETDLLCVAASRIMRVAGAKIQVCSASLKGTVAPPSAPRNWRRRGEATHPAGDRAARRVGTHAGLRARGAAAARAPPRRTWPWRSPSPGAAS